MGLADGINARHFKESVTGETLFFFGLLPWPSSWTGYIVTSDDDIAKINSHLETYQWVTNLFLAPLVSVFVMFRLRFGSMPWVSDSERVQQILGAVVGGLAVVVISAFVFRRFVLDPIIRNYPVSREKMSYREIEEKMAVRRSRSAWVGQGLVVLSLFAGGIAFLLWKENPEDRITGILLIVFAGALAAWTAYSLRLKRQRTDRDRWMVQ